MGECQECGRPCEPDAATCAACSAAAVGDLAVPAAAGTAGRHRADPSQLPTQVLPPPTPPTRAWPAAAQPGGLDAAGVGEATTVAPIPGLDGETRDAETRDGDPRDADPRDADPRDADPRDADPSPTGRGTRRVPVAVLALGALLAIGLGSGLAALRGGPDHDRAAAPLPSPTLTSAAPSQEPSPTETEESPTPTPTTSSPSPTTTRPSPTTAPPSPSPTAPPPPNAAAQVGALAGLLDQAGGTGDLIAASVGALQGQCSGHGDYGRGVSGLNQAIAARERLLAGLSGLDVSAVPHGGELKDALRRAWQSSASAGRAFLDAGQQAGAGKCPVGNDRWRAATEESQRARAAKGEAARVWNSQVAPAFGLPRRQEGRL